MKKFNSVTLQVFRKKVGRNSRYFEKKLPGFASFFILFSPKLYFRCFLGMITNHVLQPYYHVVVMRWAIPENIHTPSMDGIENPVRDAQYV